MQSASRSLTALVIAASAALAGCGGGGGGGDDGGDGGGGLVGVWKADIGGIISENPSLLGEISRRGTCSGPVVLTFKANGTFTQTLEGRCSFTAGGSATASVNASGSYEIEGSGIKVTNAVNTGVYAAAGVTQGFSLITNGLANYTLDGNVLVLTPAVERGTKQTYTRGT